MLRSAAMFLLCSALASAQTNQNPPKYKDLSATPEERARDLVSRMTLEEKVSQMQDNAVAIPRLGIPAYNWWNEALHGVARAGLATVFPQAIGLAATWDTELEGRIADIISTEARAKYNDAIAHDDHGRYHGLTFWSPNINIFRDPRWGRGQETYGEDPYLTSQMALAFIHGMQGDDPRYLKTVATSKHFAVHSGPEALRHEFNVNVNTHDLETTYLYAFRATLQPGGAQSVMCAYNSVNGAPACANTELLQTYLKEKWQFPGYVVSDCGAIGDIYHGHHYADSMAEASAKAVKAGTDLDCGTEYKTLVEAVHKGLISEAEIDKSVVRLFTARFHLGMFDPPGNVPFSNIGMDQVASPAHQKVALEAAEKSMVLLKNENDFLPLRSAPQNIAVIGPSADDPDTLLGNYHGTPPHLITPLEALENKFGAGSVHFAQGSVFAQSSAALIPTSALKTPSGEPGILAQFFNNDHFAGPPALTGVQRRGFFVWAMHEPEVIRAVPNPSFSVRFTAVLRVRESGEYRLGFAHEECDSCAGQVSTRLFVNDRPLVTEERRAATGAETNTAAIQLEAGTTYSLRLEYVQHGKGSGVELVWIPPAGALLKEAVNTANAGDLIVLCVGLNSRLEGEESKIDIPGFEHGDRTDIRLPDPQIKLLDAILATGKPVLVLLLNGSALAVPAAKERARAILEAWYPGEEGGTAVANTLTGDNNPGGKLPVTFYESVNQLPPFTDYSMKDRTYKYFTGKPFYPFGFGLSYSKFAYSDFHASRANGVWRATVQVRNTSERDGDEVVQLYATRDESREPALLAFKRVHIPAGATNEVTLSFETSQLGGREFLSVGSGQPLKEWTANGYLQMKLPR